MNIADFSEFVLARLRQEFPAKRFEPGEDLATIRCGEVVFGLTNLHAQYSQSGLSDDEFAKGLLNSFEQMIELVEASASAIPETWDEAKDRLRLQLVSSRIDELKSAITFPFSDDVTSSVVVDGENGYAYVRPEDAERWGQTSVDLIEIAKANLVTASENLEIKVAPGPPTLAIIQTGDSYDAARILLPAIREKLMEVLCEDGSSEIFVGVPNRDFLIAWSTETPKDIHDQLAATIAMDAQRQSHPLSRHLFRVTKATIVPV
ncbi:hypothetical protein [Rubripirellula obstinata]|uniref:hypothetical protein n=1 Tax=Rubripirellula obstinata TaxID=406547 RepID=UPI000831EC0B|nr:hypothetical protein [Rubripirellula obstinata]